jgi:hypothetical protein
VILTGMATTVSTGYRAYVGAVPAGLAAGLVTVPSGAALVQAVTDAAGLADAATPVRTAGASTQARLTRSSTGMVQRSGVNYRTGGADAFQIVLNDYPSTRLMSHSEIDSLLDKAVTLKAGVVRAHTLGVNIGSNSYNLVTGVSSGATAPSSTQMRATTGVGVYAISSAYTQAQMQAWKNAGGTHVLLQMFWDRWQTSQGGAVVASALAEWRGWVSTAKTVGLRVITELDVAAPPSWFTAAAPRFRQQGGTDFTGNGDTTRDFVFSSVTRGFYADFAAKVFASLTSSDLASIDLWRVGGGPLGELTYPDPHAVNADGVGWDWWLGSAAAQSGTNRVATIGAPPQTGTYPGASKAPGISWDSADVALNDWYQNAMVDFMTWWIAQHRAGGWTGVINVLHASWGVRPTRGTGDSVYRNEAAAGTDWARQMDAYPDAGVAPWCTWANRASDGTGDGDLSPALYLAKLAAARGRAWGLVAENASGASNAEMDRIFTSTSDGVLQAPTPYRGLMWVAYDTLTGGGSGDATLANATTRMGQLPADASRVASSTATSVVAYNSAVWEVMDYVVAGAASRGLYLMVPMTDELGYYHGGKRQWVNFRRPGTCSTDGNVKSANSSTERTAENYFYTDAQILSDFRTYVSDWLTHVNQYTGRAYKDEPAIAVIETGNELWTSASDAPSWAAGLAQFIKSVAPNVLVADGAASDGTPLNATSLASPYIDVVGTHPYTTFGASTVTSQAAQAAGSNKAYHVGEYGWSKTAAADIEAAVRAAGNCFFSAFWSLQNDSDLHNNGAAYGGDDVSLYVPGKDSTQTSAVSRLQAHGQSMADSAATAVPPAAAGTSDSFTGTDGSVVSAANWSLNLSSGSSATLLSNAARMVTGSVGGYVDKVVMASTLAARKDGGVGITFTPLDVSKEWYFQLALRAQTTDGSMVDSSAYRVEIGNSGYCELSRRTNGSTNALGSTVSIPGWGAGVPVTVEFYAVGTTVAVRAWTGSTRPSTATVQGTDSTLAVAGAAGLVLNGGNPASSVAVQVDNWTTNVPLS